MPSYNLNKNKQLSIFLVICILGLTFIRENLFLEINAILSNALVNRANFYLFFEYFSTIPHSTLETLKWILTISFILVIDGFSLLVVHLWFYNENYNKLFRLFFLIIIVGLMISVVITMLLREFSNYYFIFRKVIGFLQSPLPLFIFFSLYLYLENSYDTTDTLETKE